MIKITFGDNLHREQKIVDENMTVAAFMDENNMGRDIPGMATALDGTVLRGADFDKTFAEHGVGEQVMLTSMVKADNA